MSEPRWVLPLGLFMAVFMTFLAWYLWGEADRLRDFRERAVEATAQIRSLRNCRGGGTYSADTCQVSATFVTAEGRTIEIVDQVVNQRDLPAAGLWTTKILYDPEDPTYVHFDRPTGTMERILASGGLVFGVVMAAMVLAERSVDWRRRRRLTYNLLPPQDPRERR